MRDIQNILDPIFRLKLRPVIMGVRRIRIWGDSERECWGMYRGCGERRNFRHLIQFDNTANRLQRFCIIAHEYVHAWQNENNIELEHSEKSKYKMWESFFRKAHGVDITYMTRV